MSASTEIATTVKNTVAKTRKTAPAAKPVPAKPVAEFSVRTETADAKAVAAAGVAWDDGKRGVALAAAIAGDRDSGGCTTGQATFYAMLAGKPAYRGKAVQRTPYGSDVTGAPSTPAQLAKAVAAMRNADHAWVLPRVVYGVTENTVRAAFEAHTGIPQESTGVGAWKSRRSAK